MAQTRPPPWMTEMRLPLPGSGWRHQSHWRRPLAASRNPNPFCTWTWTWSLHSLADRLEITSIWFDWILLDSMRFDSIRFVIISPCFSTAGIKPVFQTLKTCGYGEAGEAADKRINGLKIGPFIRLFRLFQNWSRFRFRLNKRKRKRSVFPFIRKRCTCLPIPTNLMSLSSNLMRKVSLSPYFMLHLCSKYGHFGCFWHFSGTNILMKE